MTSFLTFITKIRFIEVYSATITSFPFLHYSSVGTANRTLRNFKFNLLFTHISITMFTIVCGFLSKWHIIPIARSYRIIAKRFCCFMTKWARNECLLNGHIRSPLFFNTYPILNHFRFSQDKEILHYLEKCSSCRKINEHKSMSVFSIKSDKIEGSN